MNKRHKMAAWMLACLAGAGAAPASAQTGAGDDALALHVPSPDWRDQIVYFVMIDRFADGDPGNNDQGAGEYDSLPHAAGQLLGKCFLEPVKADELDRSLCFCRPFLGIDPAGLQTQFNILLNCQPRQQCKCLKHHGGVGVGAFEFLIADQDLT